jgi:hypothetical protein
VLLSSRAGNKRCVWLALQVPCMFECACRGVGLALDPSSGSEDVKAKAAVLLPIWLLQPLTSRGFLRVK